MKYKAVLFDLGGTLVRNVPLEGQKKVLTQIASVLSVPAGDFGKLWLDTTNERRTGGFRSNENNIEHICNQLEAPQKENQIRTAAQIIAGLTADMMGNIREDAIAVLSQLKTKGYKLGLISDCNPEVPLLWETSPLAPLFDAAVFSCLVGMQKPDAEIYRLATDRLSIEPEDCIYVGDGGSRELSGASQVGMYPVLIRVFEEEANKPYRLNAEDWNGPSIASLTELLGLIDKI
ncbi:MAG: HAD family hydrolase [Dehalococcoidales bacterium]|nr:HAD family hydrolase [Dehalococcoidales bacterium]